MELSKPTQRRHRSAGQHGMQQLLPKLQQRSS